MFECISMKSYILFLSVCFFFASFHSEAAVPVHSDSSADSSATEGPMLAKSWFGGSRRSYSPKGKFYLQLGFTWAAYGKSDLKFTGPGYNFTLQDVSAADEPYVGSLQYNIHAGYYFKDNYSITLGYDHMKYVLNIPQKAKITGNIESEVSNPGIATGQFAGNYNGEVITITPEMLTLEYTDGFNYVSTHVQRFDDLWVSSKGNTSLSLETGLGGGLIIPRADVRFFRVGDNNKLNIAGWAASAKAGLMFNFSKRFYFLTNLEAGYSDLNKVYTTGRNDIDQASHQINFLQNSYLIGLRF